MWGIKGHMGVLGGWVCSRVCEHPSVTLESLGKSMCVGVCVCVCARLNLSIDMHVNMCAVSAK